MAFPVSISPSLSKIFFCLLNVNHTKTANVLRNKDIQDKGIDIAFINELHYFKNEVLFSANIMKLLLIMRDEELQLLLLIKIIIIQLFRLKGI